MWLRYMLGKNGIRKLPRVEERVKMRAWLMGMTSRSIRKRNIAIGTGRLISKAWRK